MTAPNINAGSQYPAQSRPGWPLGSATGDAEIAAARFVEAAMKAPTTAVDRLAQEYIAKKGAAAFKTFAYAVAAKAGVALK